MNQISLADYRQQIEDAIQDGRYEEAVAHGKHILGQYPKCVSAYWLLGKVMLEAGQGDHAMDMFQRVLSADPEHMLAWVGMSEVSRQQGKLKDAVWYLQRAFELATDNEMVAQELRQLYGQLEGSEPERLQLTEGALAKLYLRGDLLTRAITELRKLIEEHPDRLDLKVALAEALWRSGQRLQASQVSQEILEEQSYNLKSNLILGEIWSTSGRAAEAEPYLERAQALDPENEMAQDLFGTSSPLPPREPQIVPLDYEVDISEERMDWMVQMEEAVPAEVEEAMAAEIEIPSWLKEFASEPAAEVRAPLQEEELEIEPESEPELARPTEPQALEGELREEVAEEPTTGAEMPGDEMVPEEVAPEDIAEEEALDWLSELEKGEAAPASAEGEMEEEIPSWLSELRGAAEEEPIGREEETAFERLEAEGLERAEIPDWLQDLAPATEKPLETAAPEPVADVTEEQTPPERPPTEDLEEPAEIAAVEPPTGVEVTEKPQVRGELAREMAELPSWLESEELPSGEEALAWLAQLAEGQEELPPPAEREEEARLAEIVEEGEPEIAAMPMVEAEEPKTREEEGELEEAFGWSTFGESQEAAQLLEEEQLAEEAAAQLRYSSVSTGELLGILSGERAEAVEEEAELEEKPSAEAVPPEEDVLEKALPAEEPAAVTEPPAAEEPELEMVEEIAPEGLEEPEIHEPDVPVVPTAEEQEAPPAEEEPLEAEPEPVPPPMAAEPEEERLPAEEALAAEIPPPPSEEEEAPLVEEEPAEAEIEAVAPAITPEPEEAGFPPEEMPEAELPVLPIEEGEEAPPEAEVAPAAPAVAPEREEEELVAEEAPPPEPPEVTAVAGPEIPTVEEPAPAPEAPEIEEGAEVAPSAAEEKAVFEGVSPAAAMEEAPVEQLDKFIAAQQVYTEEHPDDHEAVLELGRVLWQADRRKGAVEAYEKLIRQNQLVEDVIADLEDYSAQSTTDTALMQTLGDAYMKADRLQDALDSYRRALAGL